MILRRLARPMLSAVFVSSGLDTLRDPKPQVEAAEEVSTDPELLVKVTAATQVAAGITFGLGRFPRLSALLLAASLVPTTAAGHRFWDEKDPADRAAQRTHFLKNVGLLGGLLIASADTHGKPSHTWRARHATNALVDSTAKSAKSLKKKGISAVR